MKCSIFTFIVLLFISSTSAESCVKSCSPSCSDGMICIVGTMVSQGVCPTPKCMSPEAIGLSSSKGSSNSSNAGLIGGLVGGLIGGGGLMIGAGIFFIRHKKKKNTMPLALKRNLANNYSKRSIRQEEEMIQSISRNSNVLSGVIPVAFQPPASMNGHTSVSTFATASSQWPTENNPFDNSHRQSNQNSIMTQSYLGSISRRTSVESHIEQTQATQAVRAQPQIMRVNTVRVQGLARSESFKKTLTENPFDDQNKISTRDNNTTDSVVSSADGEITIFWNGS